MPLPARRVLRAFRYALFFDGVDDYVQTAFNPILSDDVTLVMWINPLTTADGRFHGFAGYQGASAYYRPFNLWVGRTAGLHWWISKSDNTRVHNGTVPSFFDVSCVWYFIAFRKRHVHLDVFKYDLRIPLPDSPFADIYKPPYYWFGRVDNYFHGYIAQALIYSRALSDSEILWNYQYPDNPVREGLVLWFHADPAYIRDIDGDGVLEWIDLSGNSNHGKIYGATLVQLIRSPVR